MQEQPRKSSNHQEPQSLNFTRPCPSSKSRALSAFIVSTFKISFRPVYQPRLGTFTHFRVTKLLLLTHLVIRIQFDSSVNTQVYRILLILIIILDLSRINFKNIQASNVLIKNVWLVKISYPREKLKVDFHHIF